MTPATAAMGQDSTALLREAWPRHASKRLARALRCPFDTARNYVQARSRLTADALLLAAARDEALLTALETRLHALRTAQLAARVDMAGDHGAAGADPMAGAAGGAAPLAGVPSAPTVIP